MFEETITTTHFKPPEEEQTKLITYLVKYEHLSTTCPSVELVWREKEFTKLLEALAFMSTQKNEVRLLKKVSTITEIKF